MTFLKSASRRSDAGATLIAEIKGPTKMHQRLLSLKSSDRLFEPCCLRHCLISLTTLCHRKDDYRSPPPLSRLGTGTVRAWPMRGESEGLLLWCPVLWQEPGKACDVNEVM